MKAKIIIIAAAVILIVIVAVTSFIFWQRVHAPKKRVIIPKRAVAREVVKKPALPQIQKKYLHPKVVIVMDDFGYNTRNLDELFAAGSPVTFSVMPNLPYSRKVAELARSKGYEVILHQPMEAKDKSASEEVDTIKTGMNEKEVVAILEKNINGIPGIKGVSNHQGSKATENSQLMTIILKDLKNKKLFFLDSFVTQQSVCRGIADAEGVPYAKRDVFLDNTNSEDYIDKQMLALRRFAFRKGSAIAICHDRKTTIAVLNRMMPELAADGIVFTRLSEMVK